MPANINHHLARAAGQTTPSEVRNDATSMFNKGLKALVTTYAKNTTPENRQSLMDRLSEVVVNMQDAANQTDRNSGPVFVASLLSMVAASAVTGKAVGMVGEAILKDMLSGSAGNVSNVVSEFGQLAGVQGGVAAFALLRKTGAGAGISNAIAEQLRNAFSGGAESARELRDTVRQIQNQLTPREFNEMNQFIDDQVGDGAAAAADSSNARANQDDRARARMEQMV